MVENTIKTGVDELIELLKKKEKNKEKISLQEAAEALSTPVSVIHSWVDFLVEEHILGIEYKFTKPFIYLNHPKAAEEKESQEKEQEGEDYGVNLQTFKDDFRQNALAMKIPETKIQFLWHNHLINELEKKKQFFFIEANKREFFNASNLWEQYKEHLLNMAI